MEKKVLEILADVCGDDTVMEEMDIDLFEEDLLDSLGVAQLFVEFEDQLGVVIALTEVEKDDINTPEKILSLVASKAEES